jgi:beta-galactosidase
MIRVNALRLATLLVVPLSLSAAANGELFDFGWRFQLGDPPGAEDVVFDDAAWKPVDLPHDFCIEGPYDAKVKNGAMNGFRPLGVGWYRKAFVTPGAARVRLDFEGVFREAKVWVNGSFAASNACGYLGFGCDITALLRPAGQTNVVAVRADSSMPSRETWYSGGGLYRHVWLLASGEACVARHGVFVTTPDIAPAAARVKIRSEVEPAGLAVTLLSDVVDSDGKVVASARASGQGVFEQEITVREPKLWSPDSPALYRLVSRIMLAGKESDRCETPFGIREIRLTPNGLFLNGKREFVKGFNIHHDLGCLGAAAFDRAIERRLEVVKEVGCNALRLSHNPHAPALLELCDRMGILVFDEAFCNWGDLRGEFGRTWQRDLEAFLRRDRNHPCVFVWSMGNQVSAAERGPDYGCDQYDAMAAVAHRLDPTRPVTCALRPIRRDGQGGAAARFSETNGAPVHQMALHMDVMSANYMERWFARDRLAHTNLCFITSECTTGDSGRSPWKDLDREHAVGLFYWGGINYIGESRGWPLKCWSGGFVDWAGYRRPSSWILESLISERPMVRIVVSRPESTYTNWDGVVISVSGLQSHWSRPSGRDANLEVVSNAEEVELLLNGRSLGVRRRQGAVETAPRHYWTVAWEPGALVAVARNGGREVARHELRSAGAPKRLRLTPDRPVLREDGQDLSHVTAEVVDAAGVVVSDASHLITFSVSGPGVNAGVQNSDALSSEAMQAECRRAYEGRALVVVRSKQEAGRIQLRARADGLEPAELTLERDKGEKRDEGSHRGAEAQRREGLMGANKMGRMQS